MADNMRERRKGQTMYTDFMLSIVIFGIILVAGIKLMQTAYAKRTWNMDLQQACRKAMRISDYLIRNPGVPEYWSVGNVVMPGFASSDHILNITKIKMFQEIPYNEERDLLGLGTYNFLINISYGKNELLLGEAPESNAQMLIAVTRFVYLLNASKLIPAKFMLEIWK